MDSLERFARQKLEARAQAGLLRELVDQEPAESPVRVGYQGRVLLSFASNDYLGLSAHPAVVDAARRAADRAGATASRLVVGNHAVYRKLEGQLADLKRTEAAVVFGSGYHANLGIIPALVGPEDLVLIDERSHACLFSGARLSRARLQVFRHDDMEHVGSILRRERAKSPHCLILTEGVFSMDGDVASLPALAGIAREYDAWLLVDDAHGTGVIGEGRGSVAHHGLTAADVPLQVGTLSKALGAYGGFLACSRSVKSLMVNRARTLVYSTGLPPPVVAAGSAGVDIVHSESWRRHRLRAWGVKVASALGLDPPPAAILPWILGEAEAASRAQVNLLEHGLWVPAMRPPTVPDGTARLRISLSAEHTEEDVDCLVEALLEVRDR
ncbi:MAG: aminotransferase class I/II-fold pyridoxal phosphate-dependent enzyme [Myxococcota bacterium]